jgi:hypothetical protein
MVSLVCLISLVCVLLLRNVQPKSPSRGGTLDNLLRAELDRISLLGQRKDRAGCGDAAQDVLSKRDQRHCRLGRNRA